MNDVIETLCSLNERDFNDRINDDHIEKLRCIKQRLVIEFEDFSLSILIQTLNIIGEINVSIRINNLDSRSEKTIFLRELKFYLISVNHFVKNVD